MATGNEEFERQYWAVLDIRNGKVPRPLDYNRIYWDLMTGKGQKPRGDGPAVTLHELMVQEGFTVAELAMLSSAQKYSDALVQTEKTAMNAYKGLFDDGTGNFTVKKEPDRILAARILYDEAYHANKANIMRPLDEFYGMFATRTAGEVAKFEQRSINLLVYLSAVIVAILGMFVLSFVILRHQLAKRERAEATLRASEERFRLLIEKATDIVTVVNRDGVLRLVSPSIKQHLGYEPEELLNRRSLDFIEPQDVEKVAKAIQQVLAESRTVSVEYRFRHRDGSWRILESIGRSIPDQAPDGFIVVNSRDITESRKLAEHVRQAQKMDAIGALAGGIAHDFNNLLTVINVRSELMLAKMAEGAPFRDDVSLIMETGVRAANLTRQLLAFSRRQVLQPRIINLNQIITELNKMLSRLVSENISITTVLDPIAHAIKADPGQVEQVLMNLVVNARDAMPSGGRLNIQTANVQCDEVFHLQHPSIPIGAYVTMTVSDTGCGMSEQVKAHIFEPFFTTKEQGKGTGLGLATVFGIVKQSNGHVTVYSELGNGTTFCVYFPQHATAEKVQPEIIIPVRKGNGETVLVVEDEDKVRALAREVLESIGYKVLESKNGEEGLAVFKRNRSNVSLVMTDAIMPKMGGLELAKCLREIDPKVKILLVSGYTDNTLAEDLTHSLANGFVQKPFTAVALARKISDVLYSAAV